MPSETVSPWVVDLWHSLSSTSIYLLISIATLGAYVTYVSYFKKNSFSWEKYGIVHAKTSLTTFTDLKAGLSMLLREYGDKVGFVSNNITLVTSDLDLIRKVMVNDFSNFVNRGETFISNSVLVQSVFFSGDHLWKRKRQILSPNFSTSKLKIINKIVNEKAERLGRYMAECAEKKRLVPVKRVSGHFNAEVIAQTAFGCKIECFENGEDDEFTFFSQKLFRNYRTKFQRLLFGMVFRHRWLTQFLIKTVGVPFFDPVDNKSDNYFTSLIKRVLAERLNCIREGKTVPRDFLQMLINVSDLLPAPDDTVPEQTDKFSLDDILSESTLIIIAGFETTTTALQFALYFLAVHQDIQENVFQEITDKVQGDTPTYEELSQLIYTKQVIDETLRLYPPAPFVDRTASRDQSYGDFTIPANAKVVIPTFHIHRDPEIYPDPEKFNPDRFTPEEQSKRHPFAFIPFGAGPRQCLGIRLAYMELKLALVYVLRKVKIVVNDRTSPKAGGTLKLGLKATPIVEDPIQLEVVSRG